MIRRRESARRYKIVTFGKESDKLVAETEWRKA